MSAFVFAQLYLIVVNVVTKDVGTKIMSTIIAVIAITFLFTHDYLLIVNHKFFPKLDVMITAHRAGDNYGPESHSTTIQYVCSHAKRPLMIEIDVRETLDGKLILVHDHIIDRYT